MALLYAVRVTLVSRWLHSLPARVAWKQGRQDTELRPRPRPMLIAQVRPSSGTLTIDEHTVRRPTHRFRFDLPVRMRGVRNLEFESFYQNIRMQTQF